MSVTINGTSGITLPSGSSAVGTTDSQTLTNKTIGSGYAGSTVTSGTAVASTSGTSIDFTGIPSWAKRITVMFNGVSTNSGADLYIQVGNGSIVTTGYSTQRAYMLSTSAYNGSVTTSSAIAWIATTNSSDTKYGHVVLTNVSGNIWISSANVATMGTVYTWSAGGITLGGTLDRVRITTTNGTDTFDAGSINILYE